MADANVAIEFVLTNEGKPDYGFVDNSLVHQYSKAIDYDKNVKGNPALARKIYKFLWEKYRFDRYRSKKVANFMFDTYVHLPSMYVILIAFVTGNEEKWWDWINTGGWRIPDSVIEEINNVTGDDDNEAYSGKRKQFMTSVKYIRRRLERCYKTWSEKSDKSHNNKEGKEMPSEKEVLFKVFDERIWRNSDALECTPAEIEIYQQIAYKAALKIAWLGGGEGRKNPEKWVKERIGYQLNKHYTGIWGVPKELYQSSGCIGPAATPVPQVAAEANIDNNGDYTGLLAFGGIALGLLFLSSNDNKKK
jgi:hypothetical protein